VQLNFVQPVPRQISRREKAYSGSGAILRQAGPPRHN
jgi:hypothetical protein